MKRQVSGLRFPKPDSKKEKRQQRKENQAVWRGIRDRILKLDGYRCANPLCHSVTTRVVGQLEVHHLIKKGASGPDEDWNLITLCPLCHRKAHNGERDILTDKWRDAREFQIYVLTLVRWADEALKRKVKQYRWAEAQEHLERRRR